MQIGDHTLSRHDIDARIDKLTAERDDLQDSVSQAEDDLREAENGSDEQLAAEDALAAARDALHEFNENFELADLKRVLDYGCDTLIHDDYFRKYAFTIIEEALSGIESDQWPFSCIDWDQAADQLESDYTQFDICGETYWGRS